VFPAVPEYHESPVASRILNPGTPPTPLLNSASGKNLTTLAESVRHFPLFSEIPQQDCERIVALAHERSYRRGKTIFFEGDPVRQIIFLASGAVKLSQIGPQGQEVILRLVGPGEPLCVECFPKCTHCSTASAVEESAALVWEASQFQAVRDRFQILGRNITCVLVRTLNDLEVRFREVGTAKIAVRLSRQLVRLLDQIGKHSTGQVEIAVSQRDLAQLTGTTIFTVNRLLNEWQAQGIVKLKREALQVLDVRALMEVSETE
jgi:CRP-like cAMP-binding protein